MRDACHKRNTLLFEIKKENYPMSLKIKIRKEQCEGVPEIVSSTFTTEIIRINTMRLEKLMELKIQALLTRREIRDAFDIEFLVSKGVKLPANLQILKNVVTIIKSFKPADYKVKLGSILEENLRSYYTKENFKLLLTKIHSKMFILQRMP